MGIRGTGYRVYLWDGLDAILLTRTQTFEEAMDFITRRYPQRDPSGQRLEVVDSSGKTVEEYRV